MDNYSDLLQKITGKICNYYEHNQDTYDAYDSVVSAIKKYNTDILELRLKVADENLDYKKIRLHICN